MAYYIHKGYDRHASSLYMSNVSNLYLILFYLYNLRKQYSTHRLGTYDL